MTEPLFKVGSVYRDGRGWLMRIEEPSHVDTATRFAARWGDRGVEVFRVSELTGESARFNDGWRLLSTGRYHEHQNVPDSPYRLLPGELTYIDGQWISMTPTLDKLEAEKEEFDAYFTKVGEKYVELASLEIPAIGPDARMIASDDTEAARTYAFERKLIREVIEILQAAPVNNAKAPIPGLTRMSAQDHRLGLGRTF